MKYYIEIDADSSAKRGIIELLKSFAEKHKGVHIRKVSKKQLELQEEKAIARMITDAEKSGYVDTDEFLKEIGL